MGLPAGARAQKNKALDTITVQLKWYHQFQFAGFYATIEKGFYQEQGLYVKLLEGFPGVQTTQEVLKGNADFGIQTSNLLIDRANGDNINVLAAIFQHSPLVLLAQADEKFNNPQGLGNARIMLRGDSDAELRAMLINEHAGDFIHKKHEWGLESFINKNVDALSCYITDQPYDLDKRGVKYNLIKPLSYGIDFYGDCIFASEDFIENNTLLIESFIAASVKGWEYAMRNKKEIAGLILEKYSDKNELDVLLFEADAMDKLLLTELVPVGSMNKGRWRHIMKTYMDLGLINEPLDLDAFIYNPELKKSKQTKRILYGLGLIAIAFLVFVLILIVFNKRLAKKVHLRTKELQRLNNELQESLSQINEVNHRLENALCKAEESEQLKAAFIQNISHEIRTPLNVIIGFSNLVLDDGVDEKNKKGVQKALSENNEMLLKIIDDTIDISNIEINDLHLMFEPCNINELCKEVIVFNKHKVRGQTKFIYDENNENRSFNISKIRLRQVLNNLLSNAFKFTRNGEVRFGFETQLSNSNILFYVKDTGIGINENDYTRIFNSFTQLDSLTRGTGLGLYICKTLVEKMGGRIWLESETNKGSTFYFTIKTHS